MNWNYLIVSLIPVSMSVLLVALRIMLPGSKITAFIAALPVGDVIKVYCVLRGIPMPGGFSPAQAAIPSTTTAFTKMPIPVFDGVNPPMAPPGGTTIRVDAISAPPLAPPSATLQVETIHPSPSDALVTVKAPPVEAILVASGKATDETVVVVPTTKPK